MRILLRAILSAIVLVASFTLAISAVMYVYALRYVYTPSAVPKVDTALVLGASVTSGGALSPVLRERADRAIELYKENKVSRILITGDNALLTHDEVTPVRNYMIAAGIPKEILILDHAGFDTYSSMYRAQSAFQESSIVIVTQAFHLPRALFLARSMGIEAYGVSAGNHEAYWVYYIREIPASVKAAWDVATLRIPLYIHEKTPNSDTHKTAI